MAQVTVIINGKNYRMACEEGQQEQLIELSERFNRYVEHLHGSFGEIGDHRLTIMAGIMVTDELLEAQKKLELMEHELANLKTKTQQVLASGEAAKGSFAKNLKLATQRIDALTQILTKGD